MRLAVTDSPLPLRHSARRISSQLNARHRQAGVSFDADRDAQLKRCETGTALVAAQHWDGSGMAQLVILGRLRPGRHAAPCRPAARNIGDPGENLDLARFLCNSTVEREQPVFTNILSDPAPSRCVVIMPSCLECRELPGSCSLRARCILALREIPIRLSPVFRDTLLSRASVITPWLGQHKGEATSDGRRCSEPACQRARTSSFREAGALTRL